jgi:ribosomal protein L7Ae-like RNA K-turn-binding protein
MKNKESSQPVERLYPFVLRSRILRVGRETLQRSKGKLHFVLITTDLSPNSKAAVLSEFSHYPVVEYYTSADLEKFFGIKGAKVIGFAKSGLAQSIYAEMKVYRLNKPPQPRKNKPVEP